MAKEETKLLSQAEALHTLYSEIDGGKQSLSDIMEEEARKQGIFFNQVTSDSAIRGAISTGVLSFDLALGGGYAPGCVNYIYGPSGSCKSTRLFHIFKGSVERGIITAFLDYESSTDPNYTAKMEMVLSDVLGFKNKKGQWEKHPKFWLTNGSTLEGGFKYIHYMMKRLPDKIMMKEGDQDRWFLVAPGYEYTKDWLSINKGLKAKKIFEVEDGTPQMLFGIDSLVSMIGEMEEADLDKQAIGALARGLSKGFRWVKALLGRKTCNLICTNQTRINPMAMFADPETEPGGGANIFYPDSRERVEVYRSKKQTVEEPNVEDGIDRYFMGKLIIKKNKRGPSNRTMEYRLWSDEAGDPGRGIDPVFDLYQFLYKTNQVGFPNAKTQKEFKVVFSGYDDVVHTWHSFKTMALSDKGKALIKLCQAQLREGTAQERYYEHMKDEATLDKKPKKLVVGGGASSGAAASNNDDDGDDEDQISDDDVLDTKPLSL